MSMQMEQNTDVQSAEEQKWMIRIWNSGIAQNVMAIMNIARIICSHIHMLNKRRRENMKKTKIICTMEPNTNDRELMRKVSPEWNGYSKIQLLSW